MSLELKLVFLGPPLPTTTRGYHAAIDVHKDGDTVAYGSNRVVVMRSLTPGGPAKVYTEHKHKVQVARFNHSGYYIASGDDMGNLRTWSYTHAEFALKKESKQLSSIYEISWDGEGKRIAISGEGELKATVVGWDSHVNLDAKTQIRALSKASPCVAFKPNRPFRLVAGDEMGKCSFVKGPPFQLLTADQIHKNVVQCLRYSKDGSKFASCSTDKKIHVFDGKTGELVSTMKFGKKSRHNATIYGLAWNPDGTQIFTCSSDKTCKLWDVESRSLVATFNAAGTAKPQIRNQQVACAYSKHGPVSVALSGELTIYDTDTADAPIKTVIVGHQSPLSALAYDAESDTLATGCRGGVVCLWKDGVARRFSGDAVSGDSTIVHKAGIKGLSLTKGTLFSIGIDSIINTLDVSSGNVATSTGIDGAGICLASARSQPGTFVYASKGKKLTLVVGGKTAGSTSLSAEATCLAISDDGTEIIACTEDQCAHFISASDFALKNTIKLQHNISAAAYSPDKKTFALAKATKYVISLYKSDDYSMLVSSYWTHYGTVDALVFSPDGKYLVSGSKDSYITFWMPEDKSFRLSTFAHQQGVNAVVFTKTGLASIGADNCLKVWKLGAPEAAAASAGY